MAVAEKQLAKQAEKEIAKLGDGEVFVKRTGSGKIYAVQANLALREDQGEIAVIEGKAMITADGYYRANQIASLAIITPDSIKVPLQDGEAGSMAVPNPFPLIDPESGTQKGVYVKKIAVGYSPTGTLTISSNMMFYNYTTYFLQDLQKKVQYDKTAGRLCFKSQLDKEEQKTGIFMPIEGELGIWANMQHKEVLKAVSTWLANKNFGERKAQTICERNALKHHPALALKIKGLQGPEKQRQGLITVIGWQHDHSRKELEDIAAAADAGEEVIVGDKKAQVVDSTGEVDEEDVLASQEMDEEMARAAEMVNEEAERAQQSGRLF